MDKMPCLPVKITNKRWADSLQDGSVFMRSLHEYGSWSSLGRSSQNESHMKEGVQGDIGEGVVRRVNPKIGDDFFNCLEPDFRKVVKECMYIDQDRYQYYKVYCMYGLTYLLDKKCYQKPDERLKDFGDTAVIILKPNEFLNRFIRSVYEKYGDNVNFRLDEVHYYPFDYYGDLDEFCKYESYAWQNELRMRVALLDCNKSKIDQDGKCLKQIKQNIDDITINIGDIRDISVQIPIEDLIALKLPNQIKNPIFEVIEE